MFERERIIPIVLVGFLALVAYELFVLLDPFLVPIAWAILLVFLVHLLLIELDRLVGRRTLSAVILTLAVALCVILPAVWLSGRLATEAQNLYAHASDVLGLGGVGQLRQWMVHSQFIASLNR